MWNRGGPDGRLSSLIGCHSLSEEIFVFQVKIKAPPYGFWSQGQRENPRGSIKTSESKW